MIQQVNGPTNMSYSIHKAQNKFDGKEFKGVKFRYTNGLLNSDHMAPIWIQVPGLTDKEIPPDKCESGIVVLKIKDLSSDGNVNLDSMSVWCVIFSLHWC